MLSFASRRAPPCSAAARRLMPLAALLTLAAVACGDSANVVAPDISASATSAPAALKFTYDKTEPAGGLQWAGSVWGDINGNLATQVVIESIRPAGPGILHLSTTWTVTSATINGTTGLWFFAELDGTLDTRSGKLRLNGEVTSGDFAGAQMRTAGYLDSGDVGTNSRFVGTGQLMVGSAN